MILERLRRRISALTWGLNYLFVQTESSRKWIEEHTVEQDAIPKARLGAKCFRVMPPDHHGPACD